MSEPPPAPAPAGRPMLVAVVTVSYGSREVLGPFLESLPAASTEPVCVIVADNKPGSADGVGDLAERFGARYIPFGVNLGYGGAMNAAIAVLPSDVEWVLISNPDVAVQPGAIDALVATGRSDPRVGAVGPVIRTPAGDVYPSARAVPSLRTGIGHALFASVWETNPWTVTYRNNTRGDHVSARDAGWLSGACLLVRRSVFEELGGFDAEYFMYFEDVDLGYRIGKAGYRNVYEPAGEVVHTGAHSTTSESAAMVRAHHESARRFLTRRYSAPIFWPVRLVIGASLAVRSAVVRRSIR